MCEATAFDPLGVRSDFGDLRAYARNVANPARFDRWIWRCTICGLQFAYPEYTDDELNELYGPAGYVTLMQSMLHARPTTENLENWCDEYRALGVLEMLRTSRTSVSALRMLDVGCGMGNALQVFQQLGFRVTGIDVSGPEVEYVRKTLGVEVKQESLDDHVRRGVRYDVVLAAHVVEHVNRPRSFVEQLWKLVEPGGLLILETPLTNDYGTTSQRYRDIYHTLFFDHFTLALLASRASLRAVAWQNLLSYGPGDWSTNAFIRVVLREADAHSNEAGVRALSSLRSAYDGLLGDADSWMRSTLLAHHPVQTLQFSSHNAVRRRLASMERTLPWTRGLRMRLQTLRSKLRGSAFTD
ncbi:MAG TPA: methyltransferase domain-containing protein [Polyangiales bacterium]